MNYATLSLSDLTQIESLFDALRTIAEQETCAGSQAWDMARTARAALAKVQPAKVTA